VIEGRRLRKKKEERRGENKEMEIMKKGEKLFIMAVNPSSKA
jgi:hypothetical protein